LSLLTELPLRLAFSKPLCMALHNVLLQLEFSAFRRFPRTVSDSIILWRLPELRDLGRGAGSYHFLINWGHDPLK
jgi:hypothetical protein